MRSTWKLLCVAALVLAASAPSEKPATAADGPAYELKVKRFPAVGKSLTEKSTDKGNGTVKVLDDNGKVLKEEAQDETKERVFTLTTVEGGDKKPKKYKVAYEKATDTKGNNATPLSYQCKTQIYELKDDKYEITVDGGGELAAKDLKVLSEKANKPDDTEVFLPKKAVKVGDSWSVDLKELAKTLGKGPELDEDKSKGTVKLVKVTEKNNAKIGVLEIKMTLVSKAAPMFPAMTIDVDGTLETAIDGSSTAGKMTSTGKISAKGPIGKVSLDLNIKHAEETERTAEK
jgi:hypothetical protein